MRDAMATEYTISKSILPMHRLALTLLALPLGLTAQPKAEPHSSSANFSVDLSGDPDTRPSTWGTAGYVVWKVPFSVPAGMRVRILRVYGDFLAWPKGKAPEGTFAGTLLSLHASPPERPVSTVSPYLADNCFLYLQTATGGSPARAPFDDDVSAGGLLADNVLYVKAAVWLNDTGLEIHMEPTMVIVYRIEGAPAAVRVRH
jgi:hypothetical protein